MIYNFSIKDAVTKRYSVRTYDKKTLEPEVKDKLLNFADNLQNPLGPKVRVQFIEKETAENGEKLGTYGVIRGAKSYLGVTVPDKEYAMEALGYDFERLVLYATSLGLGTCWLGGTFNRSAFTAAMDIKDGELFPILSAIGYPAQKKSFMERIMRKNTKAENRLRWGELFFKDNFDKELSAEEAGEYRFPLDMLRLAPSAVNKQPWRVVEDEKGFHFFEKHTLGSGHGSIDLQRIDVGIGICHFHLAALEKNLNGRFERKMPELEVPKGMTYIVSWMK